MAHYISHISAEPLLKNQKIHPRDFLSFIFFAFCRQIWAWPMCDILSEYLMDFGIKTYGTNQSKNAVKRGGINFRCWPLLFSTTEHWVCEFVRRHFYKDLGYMFPKYIPGMSVDITHWQGRNIKFFLYKIAILYMLFFINNSFNRITVLWRTHSRHLFKLSWKIMNCGIAEHIGYLSYIIIIFSQMLFGKLSL